MSNFIRMAIAYDGPLPGYEPRAEVVTFPHLRKQTDATVVRHGLLAEQFRDTEYAKACVAEIARREPAINERSAA